VDILGNSHKIILILTTLTIAGEILSILLWSINPTLPSGLQIRFSLSIDHTIAEANAAIMTALNSLALLLIFRKNRKGYIFLIVISIINRIVSGYIFIGGIHLFSLIWTIILIVFAYLNIKKTKSEKK
jgi:hypothetical protein